MSDENQASSVNTAVSNTSAAENQSDTQLVDQSVSPKEKIKQHQHAISGWLNADFFKVIAKEMGILLQLAVLLLIFLLTLSKEPFLGSDVAQLEQEIKQAEQRIPPRFHSAALEKSNQDYLKSLETQVLDDLLILTELTVTLDVIESSQIGVSLFASFDVTVGQVMADLNQLIKKAIEVNMLSVSGVELIRILLTVSETVSPLLFQAAVGLCMFYLFLKLFGPITDVPRIVLARSRLYAKEVLLLFVIFHLLLPYSVHFSSLLSHEINQQIRNEHAQKLSNLHEQMLPDTVVKKPNHGKQLKHRASSSIDHLKRVPNRIIKQKNHSMMSYLQHIMVVNLLDLILMPLIILGALYQIIKRMIRDSVSARLP